MPTWYYFSRPHHIALHNLCSFLHPPHNLRCLLGLNLKFCPTKRHSSPNNSDNHSRFRRDMFLRFFFADEEPSSSSNYNPKLYVPSKWTPTDNLICPEFASRVHRFLTHATSTFRRRSCRSNLLPQQLSLLRSLQHDNRFVIINADKNLGPCITEKITYTKHVLNDHLLNRLNYQQLSCATATQLLQSTTDDISKWLTRYKSQLEPTTVQFLRRRLSQDQAFSRFYCLAKVHKGPTWKTRPIVSVCGSPLYGLGKWLDTALQPLAHSTPTFIKSSFDLKAKLARLPPLPPTARLFTSDAIGFYPNIDTKHGLSVLDRFLSTTCSPEYAGAILDATRLIMENNIFQFGDTFWKQLNGTAMGTPPAPMYATLYYNEKEVQLLSLFPELVAFYRYIDDIFGIWVPQSSTDDDRWELFCTSLHFGHLRWETNPRSQSVDFLDITLTIDNGIVTTVLFEKALNLYLYIPPASCHPLVCSRD